MAIIRTKLNLRPPENEFEKALEQELLAAWYELSQAVNNSIDTTSEVSSSPYTVLPSDSVLFCDTDSAAITVNLPIGIEGQNFKIINCGTSGNDVTVDGNGTETVYGELTQAISDGEVINIHYNETKGWW